jgi:hypothetical protein
MYDYMTHDGKAVYTGAGRKAAEEIVKILVYTIKWKR